jgi:hypothetical protein
VGNKKSIGTIEQNMTAKKVNKARLKEQIESKHGTQLLNYRPRTKSRLHREQKIVRGLNHNYKIRNKNLVFAKTIIST